MEMVKSKQVKQREALALISKNCKAARKVLKVTNRADYSTILSQVREYLLRAEPGFKVIAPLHDADNAKATPRRRAKVVNKTKRKV
jgi:hypothetical protein